MPVSVFEGAVFSQLVYEYGHTKKHSDEKEHKALTMLGGWQRMFWTTEAHTGFQGAVFTKNTDMVVAFRGSDDFKKDWAGADFKIATHWKTLNHDEGARKLIARAKEVNPGKVDVTVVGHSLGGHIAQVAAARYGCYGLTYNAPGVVGLQGAYGDICWHGQSYNNTIANFRAELDVVSSIATGLHLGAVYNLGDWRLLATVYGGPLGLLVGAGVSHMIAPMLSYFKKKPWKDLSPFDPKWPLKDGGLYLG